MPSILLRSLFLYHHAPKAAKSFLKVSEVPDSLACVYGVMNGPRWG